MLVVGSLRFQGEPTRCEQCNPQQLWGWCGSHTSAEFPVDRGANAEVLVSFLNFAILSLNPRTVTTLVMSIPIPLQEALRDSITSGTFIDTKFWVFSKRRSSVGRVGGPKALFVNERVVRRVPRLRASAATPFNLPKMRADPLTVLDGSKTKEDLRVWFPSDRNSYTDDYDYEDDSDLDEDEDDDIFDGEPVVTRSGDDSELVTVESADAKGNDSSDVISSSDLDSLFSDSPDTKDEGKCVPSTHVGRVVIIEDVAFVT